MKKKILIIVILLLGLVTITQAQDQTFFKLKAYKAFVVRHDNNVKEIDVNLDVTLDIARQHCTIYSNEVQRIDYIILREYQGSDGYYEIDAKATDSNYKQISFDISINTTGLNIVIITITYSDVAYAYRCKIIQ